MEYLERKYCAVVSVQESTFNHSGDNGEGDPPVLIPNTEVKPFSADGTWLDTTWESRTSPVPIKEKSSDSLLFSFIPITFYLFTFHYYVK